MWEDISFYTGQVTMYLVQDLYTLIISSLIKGHPSTLVTCLVHYTQQLSFILCTANHNDVSWQCPVRLVTGQDLNVSIQYT